ncbi:MAG: FtsX-like permease family protein [Thermoanaerobaculia bacterium]
MSYELRVALRYLWSARKKAHTAFLASISALGLGVGVATLLISISLLSGLQGNIKQRLIESSPQLLIEPAGRHTIENPDAIIAFARASGARDIEPVVSGIAWAAQPSGSRGRPVRLRSYTAATRPAADQSFGREWKSTATAGTREIYLTRGFAAALGVFLDDEVMIVAPRTRLTPFGPVPVYRKYKVTRLLVSGQDERSPEGFLSDGEMSDLFATGGLPTIIEVRGDAARTEGLREAMSAKFPSLLVKSWKEINKPLFLALRLEKIVMFAAISMIIFVAALNLISSLSMLIVEKRGQVGVLRTMGATERSILAIFLGVGLLIGIAGTVLGNIIGLGIAWAAERYHMVPLPGDGYDLAYLPFTIDAVDVIGVNAVAIALSVLATWYPARTASRLDPVVAIREE